MVLLSGCVSLNPWKDDYGCRGYPEGVRCKSAREVYHLTNYQEALSTPADDEDQEKKADCDECGEKAEAAVPVRAERPPTPSVAAVQGLGYVGPMPLRTPARIMRIWIAPWESLDGVLHLPTYLYAEVEERRWLIGEARMEVAPRITPLAVAPEPPAAAGQPEKPAAGPASPFPSPLPGRNAKNAPKSFFFESKPGQPPVDNKCSQ